MGFMSKAGVMANDGILSNQFIQIYASYELEAQSYGRSE